MPEFQILVRRTKLSYGGNPGEAPAGTTCDFDLMQHPCFMAQHGHRPLARLPEYAATQIQEWNRQQPNNWKYELI